MSATATQRPPRYGELLLVAAALWTVAVALLGIAVLLLCVMVVMLIPDLMSFGDETPSDGEPWWGWASLSLLGAGLTLALAVPLDAASAVQAVRRLRRGGQERTWPVLVLVTVGICSALPLLLAPLLLVPELLPGLVVAASLWVGLGLSLRITVAVHGIIDLAAVRS